MRRIAPAALALALAVSSCTGEPPARSRPSPGEPSSQTPSPPAATSPSPDDDPDPIVLDVVADLPLLAEPNDQSYLEGMELAVEEVNAAGGVGGRALALELHDEGGVPARATQEMAALLSEGATTILYAGAGTAIPPLRQQFAGTGTPVVLLGGDLYTSRGLFPQVFQTTVPWVWQANVLARYLVTDRKAENVVFVGVGPEADLASASLTSALEYWGGRLVDSFVVSEVLPLEAVHDVAAVDWVVAFGAAFEVLEIQRQAPAALGAGAATGFSAPSSLLIPDAAHTGPPAGAAACYTYTWAGWAEPIPRVRGFIERFEDMFGRRPAGLEQEGFDAVRIVAEGLRATGGRGGDELVRAIENLPERTFSSFPIDFGPDDHLFMPRSELGLFAVPGPKETLDPWQTRERDRWLWRPIMRTFTYNGERTSVLEGDRRVFFPGWRKSLPAPTYTESRYGIVTGHSDPLH
ncbi:MAG: ABC transporter substrate-binding protein [Actinobacteria bacterium]|nr:ABC transporter substrate-binding protein [Actinomycetota bacterium]